MKLRCPSCEAELGPEVLLGAPNGDAAVCPRCGEPVDGVEALEALTPWDADSGADPEDTDAGRQRTDALVALVADIDPDLLDDDRTDPSLFTGDED